MSPTGAKVQKLYSMESGAGDWVWQGLFEHEPPASLLAEVLAGKRWTVEAPADRAADMLDTLRRLGFSCVRVSVQYGPRRWAHAEFVVVP